MIADLKPCPFCGEKVEMHDYTNAHVAAWVMIHRCQVVGVIHLQNYSGTRLAEVWNTRAPAVSDTGADSGPGSIPPQPGEAPVSDAPATAWQPIETAPRDGSPIVAWFDNSPDSDGFAVIVRWDAPARHRDYPWIDQNGRFAEANISHWMPLPAPPVDSSAAPSTPVDNQISADPVGKEG